MKSIFGERNATMGLPTKFELVQKDDQFTPARAAAAAQELVQKDQVEAMTGVVGTPQVVAGQEVLHGSCVPLIPAVSGGQKANNPEQFPWSVAVSVPFVLEARIWVQYLTEQFPDGAKVALFTANTESGKDYVAGVKRFLAGTKHQLVAEQTVEAADSAAPSSQVTTMRASGANALLAAPLGGQCPATLSEVANQGWTPRVLLTSTCSGSSYIKAAGAAGDRVLTTLYVKDPQVARWADDPGVKAAKEAVAAHAPGSTFDATALAGYFYGESFWEAARVAAQSPLGLSRLGLLAAATHLDFQPVTAIPGVRVKLDGLTDTVAIEAAELNSYSAATGTFTPIKLYDFEGQLSG